MGTVYRKVLPTVRKIGYQLDAGRHRYAIKSVSAGNLLNLMFLVHVTH